MPEIKTDEAEKNGAAASAEAPGTKDVKKNKKQKEEAEIVRFNPDKNIGLTEAQVTSRQEQGLVNSAPKKYSKTYGSIFFGNIFTFFNFLCVVAAVALVLAPPFSVHVRADFYLQHRGSHRAGNPRESKNR